VPTWRRLAIVGMSGFVVAVAIWAFRPWTSAVSVPTVDDKSAQALFRCGAPFGADRVEPSNDRARVSAALPHRPCTTRSARRVLAVVDVVLGSIGVAVLVTFRRPHEPVAVELTT